MTREQIADAIKKAYEEGFYTGPDGAESLDESWLESDAKQIHDKIINGAIGGGDEL